jgi:hypothetical protein
MLAISEREKVLMYPPSPLVAAAAAVSVAAFSSAAAEQIEWTKAIYAEVVRADHGGAVEQVPFFPYQLDIQLPRDVLRVSMAGTPGIVVAGSAAIGDGGSLSAPTTPYVAKLALDDGRILWTWQPNAAEPPPGHLWSIATDASGDVYVAGFTTLASPVGDTSLIAKVDGADGTQRWRVDGPGGTHNYELALDGAGSVFVVEDRSDSTEVVWKLATENGAAAWSGVTSAAASFAQDFRLALDAEGNALVAGSYFDGNEPLGMMGVQVSKFDGSTGLASWQHRLGSSAWRYGLQKILATPDGDAIVASHDALARLSAADGSERWQALEGDGYRAFDRLVGADGAIYGAGETGQVAWLRRYDADSGGVLWETPFTPGAFASASTLAAGVDGNVLAGWQYWGTDAMVGALAVAPADGRIDWSVEYGVPNLVTDNGRTAGVLQIDDGTIYVGSYLDDTPQPVSTWNLAKIVADPVPDPDDPIFANGFD